MSEKEMINFGVLNGWLKAIARVNDKTDNGHHFELYKYEKTNNLSQFVEEKFSKRADKIEIKSISKPEEILQQKIGFWFFNYQPNKFSGTKFLEDKKGDFSLYDNDYKEEWIKEFVTLLIETTQLCNLFQIKLLDLKSYYCNMSDDLIIEGESELFHLHFCLTD